jgi:hypothetical protein
MKAKQIKGMVGRLYGVTVLPETTEEWFEFFDEEIPKAEARGYKRGKREVLENMPIHFLEEAKKYSYDGQLGDPNGAKCYQTFKRLDYFLNWRNEQLNHTHREER